MDPMLVIAAVVIVALLLLVIPKILSILSPQKPFLDKSRKRIMIMDVQELSHDVKRFRLSLESKTQELGLPVGKHIRLYAPNPDSCISKGTWNGRPDEDKKAPEVSRMYTPTPSTKNCGFVDVVIKMYRPGSFRMPDGREVNWEDGGKMSGCFLDKKKPGDYLDILGPLGVHEYLGRGQMKTVGQTLTSSHFGMIAGGTGLTPILQVIYAALHDPSDSTRFSMLYANKTQDDILCRELMEQMAEEFKGRFTLHYTLDFPPDGWTQKSGFITADMIKECLPPPEEEPVILMCGPPPMIEHACKKNLLALNYPKNRMVAF